MDPISVFERTNCNMNSKLMSLLLTSTRALPVLLLLLHTLTVLLKTQNLIKHVLLHFRFNSMNGAKTDSVVSNSQAVRNTILIHTVKYIWTSYQQLFNYPRDNIVYPSDICSSTCYCTHSLTATDSCSLPGLDQQCIHMPVQWLWRHSSLQRLSYSRQTVTISHLPPSL